MKLSPPDPHTPAISVRQPWAGAIALLGKDVENRSSWKYKYRGPIIVHASSYPFSQEEGVEMLAVAAEGAPDPEAYLEVSEEISAGSVSGWMVPGRILGVADLIEVYSQASPPPTRSTVWKSAWRAPDANYWLQLGNFRACKPLPAKGRVGLFYFDPSLVKKMKMMF